MIRAARVLGPLLCAVGLLLGLWFGWQHLEARATWQREAARLGAPDYDPAASDRAYDEVLESTRRARLAALISIPGWVLLGLFTSSPRERLLDEESPRRRAAHLATLVDGALVLAVVYCAASIEGWAGPAFAGAYAVLAVQIHGAALAMAWGAFATGDSVGGLVTRTVVVDAQGRRPGAGRGLAALLLWPIGLLWAPIALAFGPGSEAPHLAWTGLHRVASQSPNE